MYEVLLYGVLSLLVQVVLVIVTFYYMRKQAETTIKSLEKPAIVEVVRYCIAPLKEMAKELCNHLERTSYPREYWSLDLDVEYVTRGCVEGYVREQMPVEVLVRNLVDKFKVILDRYHLRERWDIHYSAYQEKLKELGKLTKQVEGAVINLLQRNWQHDLERAFKSQEQSYTRDKDLFKRKAAEEFLMQLNMLEKGTALSGSWHYLGEGILKQVAGKEEVQQLLSSLKEVKYKMLKELKELLEILETVISRLEKEYKLTPTETTPVKIPETLHGEIY